MIALELRTPLSEREVRSLKVGDRISISGTVYSMRDQATLRLLRMLRKDEEPPVDISGSVVFHAGPAVDLAGHRILSIGPTTSARMNSITPELIRRLGIRAVLGKGGMDDAVLKQLTETGCIYASAIGGCSTLYTRSVTELKRIVWGEMGPEAIYELEVERFAPLVVTMDSSGNSLHDEIERNVGDVLSSMNAPGD